MTRNKSLDPRYLINIQIGMHVMIQPEELEKSELVSCVVRNIITKDSKNEYGIKVECEDGKKGRVRFIGEEAEYKDTDELLTLLEKRLRQLIKDVLSKTSPNWWQEKISDTIRENVNIKNEKHEKLRKQLDIQHFSSLDQTCFIHLLWIIGDKKNYEFFKQIFGEDRSAISVKLFELSHFRNVDAHSKDLTNLEKMKIRVYYHDFDYQLNRYYKITK